MKLDVWTATSGAILVAIAILEYIRGNPQDLGLSPSVLAWAGAVNIGLAAILTQLKPLFRRVE